VIGFISFVAFRLGIFLKYISKDSLEEVIPPDIVDYDDDTKYGGGDDGKTDRSTDLIEHRLEDIREVVQPSRPL
jgi:hypothetical protein